MNEFTRKELAIRLRAVVDCHDNILQPAAEKTILDAAEELEHCSVCGCELESALTHECPPGFRC